MFLAEKQAMLPIDKPAFVRVKWSIGIVPCKIVSLQARLKGTGSAMASLKRRWSIRPPQNCNVQISLYLLLGTIFDNFESIP